MSTFTIKILHPVNREEAKAKLYYDSELWAEITTKKGKLVLLLYAHPDKDYWDLPCEEAVKTIAKAQEHLLATEGKRGFLKGIDPKAPQEAKRLKNQILDHPQKYRIQVELARFGSVVDVYEPEGKGARYTEKGHFVGFLE